MSRKRTGKTFDALAFKGRAREEIFEAVKNLTVEEQIAYYRECAESGPLGDRVKSIQRASEERRRGVGPGV
jgi:hypothetical protein